MRDFLRRVAARLATVCVVLLPALSLIGHANAQETDLSLSPGADAPPWRLQIPLTDGRTFVSNGHIAIDAAFAKLEVLPASIANTKVIEDYLTAPFKDEFELTQLRTGVGSRDSPNYGNYTAPSGVVLNALYVDYLFRTLPAGKVRLGMRGDADPVVILLGTTPVGLLMPVRR
jgi:hypothetical protein